MRLRIDARKRSASKLRPLVYGGRIDFAVSHENQHHGGDRAGKTTRVDAGRGVKLALARAIG